MNDMRLPPGLLNTLQGPQDARGREGRTPGAPDIEAARAFDRLFQDAMREPAREPAREPVRDPVREPVREPAREQSNRADRSERAADAERTPDAGKPRADRPAADKREPQDTRANDTTHDADHATAPRSARTQPSDDGAGAHGSQVKAGDSDAPPATPQLTGVQLALDTNTVDAQQAAQHNAQVLDALQAASAALLQAAQGLADPGAAGAAAEAKAGPVAKHVDTATDPLGAASTAAKDAKDSKAVAATDFSAGTLGATTDAQARTGVRDRLLEDFERRFERSLAAAASGGREGFTPGTTQALAALAPNNTLSQPIYSSAHATIGAPLTQPAFGDELANRVLLFAGQRVQNAELAITPADLGPIKVSIELRGQEATLAFTAQHATTRAAIEDALPKLRDMFAGQGLQLAQAHVGDQRRQDGGRYPGQGGNGTRGIGEAGRAERPGTIGAGGTGGLPNAYGVRGLGLIDIHV